MSNLHQILKATQLNVLLKRQNKFIMCTWQQQQLESQHDSPTMIQYQRTDLSQVMTTVKGKVPIQPMQLGRIFLWPSIKSKKLSKSASLFNYKLSNLNGGTPLHFDAKTPQHSSYFQNSSYRYIGLNNPSIHWDSVNKWRVSAFWKSATPKKRNVGTLSINDTEKHVKLKDPPYQNMMMMMMMMMTTPIPMLNEPSLPKASTSKMIPSQQTTSQISMKHHWPTKTKIKTHSTTSTKIKHNLMTIPLPCPNQVLTPVPMMPMIHLAAILPIKI